MSLATAYFVNNASVYLLIKSPCVYLLKRDCNWQVIAKGEAQGMVSKFIGIGLGIALANCIQGSTPLALASFGVVTWIHMFCNLKSYQAIQLRSLNPYRASTPFFFFSISLLHSILW